ncbi:hypothetical protein GMA8713_04838 [Grimontia marina]|uniref:Uncharacterized protein n=1 Tax=Grimontia marina TaxID=646534 RepID=A0A128FJ35_9GAMM|nr:hypothetical protein GMA8713_04838 [Grimontia marina]
MSSRSIKAVISTQLSGCNHYVFSGVQAGAFASFQFSSGIVNGLSCIQGQVTARLNARHITDFRLGGDNVAGRRICGHCAVFAHRLLLHKGLVNDVATFAGKADVITGDRATDIADIVFCYERGITTPNHFASNIGDFVLTYQRQAGCCVDAAAIADIARLNAHSSTGHRSNLRQARFIHTGEIQLGRQHFSPIHHNRLVPDHALG